MQLAVFGLQGIQIDIQIHALLFEIAERFVEAVQLVLVTFCKRCLSCFPTDFQILVMNRFVGLAVCHGVLNAGNDLHAGRCFFHGGVDALGLLTHSLQGCIQIFQREKLTLLASGVSLVRALTIISQDEGISAGLRRIYESVLSEVRKGSSLSAALEAQQVFPTLMLGMIRAGEGSGKLDQVAERLAIHYEKAHQMNQQVKSALMYPMILAILAVAVVIVIVTFVLPQFSDLFSTMDSLPGVTLALMAFSNFMVTKWYLMILGVAAVVVVIRTLLRIPAVRLEMDRRKLKMPVFGPLNQVICTARFARTISSLYSSGLPIVTALQTARDTIGNAYIISQFDDVLVQVRSGVSLSAALENVDGFQRKLCSSIAVGEETGRLDSMLDSIADSMEYDAQQASKRMMTILEPMLIVLMAFVVGFIIIAVMSPIIGSYSAIESSGNV